MKIEINDITYPAGLYLVATPIGNLKDITLRALEALSNVDLIYCEDTRQTMKLLNAYSIKTRTAVYHDHSPESVRAKIIHQISEEGKSIALVSDAGMPLISDPGHKLTKEVSAAGITVTSLPGANAVLTGLQLSGLPSEVFSFLGFLPAKQAARQSELIKWSTMDTTLIFYEAKQRLTKALLDIQKIYGEREVVVARELTKKFEEVISGSAKDILDSIKDRTELKGEFVLLIAPYKVEKNTDDNVEALIRAKLTKNMPVKQLAEEVALISGWPKKDVYNKALLLKNT